MEAPLFDTHAHLDDERFDDDRAKVLQRMKETGVGLCVAVGSDLATSRAAMDLARHHAGIYFAAGVHPHEAKSWKPGDEEEVASMLADPKNVALGEIGLDFHYDFSPRTDQKSVFMTQLELAHTLGKPAILHVREAHGDMLDILRSRRAALPRCVVHCYSGSWESALEYMSLGCMISLAGPVTFKNANKLLDVARLVPIDRLLIETDSPYLAPVPERGKRNEPAMVAYVARKIAEIRGVSEEEIRRATYENGRRFFGIANL